MDVINQVAITIPLFSKKLSWLTININTKENQCSISEPQAVNTSGILIVRSLVKPETTGNVSIIMTNIVDQAVILQSSILPGVKFLLCLG